MASDAYAPHPDDPGARALATDAFARPHSSRVWNYAAGGKNNFHADRELCHELAEAATLSSVFADIVSDNQAFLQQAVNKVLALGITQFIDLGPGIPATVPNVYTGVLASDPRAKVVYVDNDPVVIMHTWQLIDDTRQSRIVEGNILEPEQLLKDNEILDFLDWSQPIALICTAVLHEHPGPVDDLTAIMQTYVDQLPPGSCTVISHLLNPEGDHTETVEKLEAVLVANAVDFWFRTRAEIEALFPGQQFLADVQPCWHSRQIELAAGTTPPPMYIAGGIGQVDHNGKPT